MFLSVGFSFLGYSVFMGRRSSPLVVGFMIGIAAMLCQLFFMLAIIFFAIGTEAGLRGIGTLHFLIIIMIILSQL